MTEKPKTNPPTPNPTSPNAFLNDILLSRLRNLNGVSEGGVFPPALRNGIRIPPVSKFKVATTTAATGGGTDFTLTWLNPEDTKGIANFNIYAFNAFQDTKQPIAITSVPFSPAIVHIANTNTGRKITFFCQPELHNGLRGEVNFNSPSSRGLSSPSCVGILL